MTKRTTVGRRTLSAVWRAVWQRTWQAVVAVFFDGGFDGGNEGYRILRDDAHNEAYDAPTIKSVEKRIGGDTLRATYLFPYQNPAIRSAIWRIKYRKDVEAVQFFARHLAAYLQKEFSNQKTGETRSFTLLPIPLSKQRRRERGYNQIELLLEACMGQSTHFSYRPDLLYRTRHTLPQSHTENRADRLVNLRDIFQCKAGVLEKNTYYILADDVITTGATMYGCKQALTGAGVPAEHIFCIGVAG